MPIAKFMNLLFILFISIPLSGVALAGVNPKVKLETTLGNVVLELYPDKAPETVANFLNYVDNHYYDGTLFHRVIKGFMIQGGGFNQTYFKKPTLPPIKNEADNGLSNQRGAVAMARTSDPHSAAAQFFINTVDNKHLNFRFSSGNGWGYCVFGKVIEGMDVVEKIEQSQTGAGPAGTGLVDVPVAPVIIKKASQIQTHKPLQEKST